MPEPEKNRRMLRTVIVIVLIAALLLCTILATRWVLALRDPDKLRWFREVIEGMGLSGWLVLLAIQYLQIVVAFVPGGPIQLLAGALFGPWGGAAVCFTGTLLASSTVYWLVSRWGRSAVLLFVGEKDLTKYKFLHDNRKLERLVILLFFIPGTPKDALTYLFALTPLPIRRFLLLSTLARLPAVLTSVLAGDRIVSGQWLQAAALFAAISAVSLVGFLLHKKILARFHHAET